MIYPRKIFVCSTRIFWRHRATEEYLIGHLNTFLVEQNGIGLVIRRKWINTIDLCSPLGCNIKCRKLNHLKSKPLQFKPGLDLGSRGDRLNDIQEILKI